MTALHIPLRRVTAPVRGVYDINRDGKKEELPKRALWLAPEAADWFNAGHGADLVVSDMFRGPDSSKAAVASGRGAAAPGRSSHNYGRAIDIDVGDTMRRLGLGTKAELDVWMASGGWFCWREDHAMPSWKGKPNEAWHYFWAPDGVRYIGGNAVKWWSAELERAYPARLSVEGRQEALGDLGYYGGAFDGRWGPLSQRAATEFAISWGRSDDRTLAFVDWHRYHRRT